MSGAIALPGDVPGEAALGRQAYVSMPPGTDTAGRQVEITNAQNGASAKAPIVAGGFDPVPIRAKAEDTLSVTILHYDGSRPTSYTVVPLRSRPAVVRTSPAAGRTDVPLNSLLTVVFSEPMDSASLPASLRLLQGLSYVRGTVSFQVSGGAVLGVLLVPDSLVSGSNYTLTVSRAARAISGETLESEFSAEFTTERSSLMCVPPPEGWQPEDSISAAAGGRIVGRASPSFILLQYGSTSNRMLVYGPDLAISPSITGVIYAGPSWCNRPNQTTYNGRDWPTGEHLYLRAVLSDSSGVPSLMGEGSLRYDTAAYTLLGASLPGMTAGRPLPPAEIANVVGSWILNQAWGPRATFDVAADGTIAVGLGNCTLTGTIRPGQGSMFQLSAQMDPNSCVDSWDHVLPFDGVALAYPLENGGWQFLVRLETNNGVDWDGIIGLGRR